LFAVSRRSDVADTNTGPPSRFVDTIVIDIPPGRMGVGRLPEPPPGFEISRVDVVVRLRRVKV
jgi:Fur family iron response transcriptional regulator